jgi:hypothetical protein
MRSAVYSHIDYVSAVGIVVDFAWLCLILKGLRRGAVALLVSFLAVFRALSHALNSLTTCHLIITCVYEIITCVYERHSSPKKGYLCTVTERLPAPHLTLKEQGVLEKAEAVSD